MAQGNQPQKTNLAAEAFRRNYAALHSALAQPDVASGLAVTLYSEAIITLRTRDAVQMTSLTPAEQVNRLLRAVESSIDIDYTRLRKFTRVLRKQPVLQPTAKQLRQCYCELLSEARLTESSSSGSDTDSAKQHHSQRHKRSRSPELDEVATTSSPPLKKTHVHASSLPSLPNIRAVLDNHMPSILEKINLQALIPYLISHGLLTEHEKQLLRNNDHTEHQRKQELISIIQSKGSEGCRIFLSAVSEEPEHLGHREIAAILTDPGSAAVAPITGQKRPRSPELDEVATTSSPPSKKKTHAHASSMPSLPRHKRPRSPELDEVATTSSPPLKKTHVHASSLPLLPNIRAVLDNHMPSILEKINLQALIPYLISHGLLTEHEKQLLRNNDHTEHQRKQELISIIQSKGSEGCRIFLSAVSEEPEHLGHREIAAILTDPGSAAVAPITGQKRPRSPELDEVATTSSPPSKKKTHAHASSMPSLPSVNLITSDLRAVLDDHMPSILEMINLQALIPYLISHGLLTEHEKQLLRNNDHTEHQRKQELISIIQSKGSEGCRIFLAAVSEEPEHLGHREIAATLSNAAVAPIAAPKQYKKLKAHLKRYYKSKRFYNMSAGPNIENIEFINLALVHNQGISADEKERDMFLKSTLHGLVDDIERRKESIDLQKIFAYGTESRKLVLVEGAPGAGKTMLAMKICRDWAEGKMLSKEYDVVILVPLRAVRKEFEIKDLVYFHNKDKVAAKYLADTDGNRVLIILEGWDELAPSHREQFTFFFDLIDAIKLPLASIMVTSRPTVTTPLYDYMDERRIEVLGFNDKQIKKFVKRNAPKAAKIVLEHLERFPNLKALAHIPFTLVVLIDVVRKFDCLPSTLTTLYDRYICKTLFQNLKSQLKELKCRGIDSVHGLPIEAQPVVRALCKLALQGFKDNSFVFKSKDLEAAGLAVNQSTTQSFDGYGLLSTYNKSAAAGYEVLYQFRHLSIQEFLAALQIKQLEDEAQIQLLQESRKDKRFQHVWKFLAGLTNLKNPELQSVIISEVRASNPQEQLFLLHCLYEAQNAKICQAAATKLNYTLNLNNVTLNPSDCLCAAYSMGSTGGEWTMDLRGCNVGAGGIKMLKPYLMNQVSSLSGCKLRIASLNLTHNRMDTEAISHIAEIIRENSPVAEIDLSLNKLNCEDAVLLAEALTKNQTLRKLTFTRSESVTEDTAEKFASVLKRNETLQCLRFSFEPIGDSGAYHLASLLTTNQSLVELKLKSAGIGHSGLQMLADALTTNHTLKILRLDRNTFVSDDCSLVANIIERNDTLCLLDLSNNIIGDSGLSMIMNALIAKPLSSLKMLGVYGCNITAEGILKLSELFRVTEKFEAILLGCNPLEDEGAKNLVMALSQNASRSVKKVVVNNTQMSEKGEQLLETHAGSIVTFKHQAWITEWADQFFVPRNVMK